ncbi:hypothetical protein BO71DRAFT_432572 [Aspergillus ellipticus CBS 707.79]|uniref:Uncharacterized protein n=1 Tax=Aspergillus ellipticus CBS 707.79 TaxID=1448320 RepID=A0A319D3B2_9EURO|nr:hypothetical protein BO71DRAFT_432572 [Aspergillus ellipticus CBS 707.79]
MYDTLVSGQRFRALQLDILRSDTQLHSLTFWHWVIEFTKIADCVATCGGVTVLILRLIDCSFFNSGDGPLRIPGSPAMILILVVSNRHEIYPKEVIPAAKWSVGETSTVVGANFAIRVTKSFELQVDTVRECVTSSIRRTSMIGATSVSAEVSESGS